MTEDIQEPVITMHTWTDRVLEEKDILQKKIDSLIAFTVTAQYGELTQDEQLLLQAQLSVMVAYSQLLTLRIISNIQGDLDEDKPNTIE